MELGKTVGSKHLEGHRETKQFGLAYRQLSTAPFMRHYKVVKEYNNFVEAVENSPQAWLSEYQTHSYLTFGRDCHQRMLEAETGLDREMIEMGDKVCWQIMQDFEGEDRRLVFEGIAI